MLRRAHEHAVEIARVVRVGDEIELLVKIGVRSPETARTKAEMPLRTRRDLSRGSSLFTRMTAG